MKYVLLLLFASNALAQVAQQDFLQMDIPQNPALTAKYSGTGLRYFLKSYEGALESVENGYEFKTYEESLNNIYAFTKFAGIGIGFEKTLTNEKQITEKTESDKLKGTITFDHTNLSLSYPLIGRVLQIGGSLESFSSETAGIKNQKSITHLGAYSKVFSFLTFGAVLSQVTDTGDLKAERSWYEKTIGLASDFKVSNEWEMQVELIQKTTPEVFYASNGSKDPNYHQESEQYDLNLRGFVQLLGHNILISYLQHQALYKAYTTGNDTFVTKTETRLGARFMNGLISAYYGIINEEKDYGKNRDVIQSSTIGIGMTFNFGQDVSSTSGAM